MMIPAEKLAREFHDVYERLAPSFGYETRHETRHFNPDTPNGQLMIAVCGEMIEAFIPRATVAASLDLYESALSEAEAILGGEYGDEFHHLMEAVDKARAAKDALGLTTEETQ